MDAVRDEIVSWLDGGADLADVESELIDELTTVSEDDRDALWLFAWSYSRRGRAQVQLAASEIDG